MRRNGHIRERSPGSFELRYSLGTDLATGRRKVATTTVKGSRKEAEKELRRLLRTVDTGEHIEPHRVTVREYLDGWIAAIKDEIEPTTHKRYAELVSHYIAPALGNLLLQKLAPVHLREFYTALGYGGRRDGRDGPLSPQTRRHIHRVFHTALVAAVELQIIARNPAAVFRKKLPKVKRHEMATLTAEQSARLLGAVRHSHVYWPVLLALATGARRGEVLALRWRNVDLDRAEVRIVESLEQVGKTLRFKSPKSDKARVVTLPSFAVEELRRLKREQAESLLLLGIRQTGAMLLCARADGEPLQPQSLTHEFPRFLGRLGVDFPKVRFHDLRHTHATQLLFDGVHPKVVQERLGHASIGVTLDIYSHVSPTMQEDAAARLDAALGGAIKSAGKPVR
jgi:integrase